MEAKRQRTHQNDIINNNNDDDNEDNNNEDRISALPANIIHEILSLLPTDVAVNTSELSRTWKSMWLGLACLTFDKTLFHRPVRRHNSRAWEVKLKAAFYEYIDRTLARWSKQTTTKLTSFNVYAPSIMRPDLSSRLDRWINLIINVFRAEELVYHCQGLRRVPLSPLLGTLLLKRLELSNVELEPDLMLNLSQHCPLMERLCFNKCSTPVYFKVSGFSKLVEFVLNKKIVLIELQIDDINLQFKRYFSNGKIEVYRSRDRLVDLRLSYVSLWPQCHLSFVTNLEVKSCEIRTAVISSDYLKNLSFQDCYYKDHESVKINAPNLRYLNFSGYISPVIDKLNHSGLERATIYWSIDIAINEQLLRFLAKINPCKELIIQADIDAKGMIIQPEHRENLKSPLPDVKHVQVKHCKRSMLATTRPDERLCKVVGLVDSLLWLSPGVEIITISTYRYQPDTIEELKVLKLKYSKGRNEGSEKCSDCEVVPTRCWKHRLEEVTIENQRVAAKALTYRRENKRRAKVDSSIKAFFENARENDKISVQRLTH